jgi:hypothetical protein
MRVKYPEIFFGTFASGPLTKSFGPVPKNTANYGSAIQVSLNETLIGNSSFLDQLSNIYCDASSEAAAKIQAAMMEFYTCASISNVMFWEPSP